MFVPDTLSRAALSNQTPEISNDELNAFVNSVIPNIPMSGKRLNQFRTETSNDKTLQIAKQHIQSGWPNAKDIEIVSYNGPEYSAKAYDTFCKDWDITTIQAAQNIQKATA